MKLHHYKHIGYYYQVADVKELGGQSADEILDYYKHGYGAFSENHFHEEDTDLIAEEESSDSIRYTEDKKFAIWDGSYPRWFEQYKDSEDGDDAGCFIDIYELYKEEGEDKTYEVCPYCESEVLLDAELKVQKCPHCGKYIVTCSMCRNKELNYECSADCCLEVLAHTMNAETEE